MSQFLTSEESIALTLIFASMGESRFNRTNEEYAAIAARAPKLSAMHEDVNRYLDQLNRTGCKQPQRCTFQRGDRYYRYEDFPTSVSRETTRLAWVKSGMRELQKMHKQPHKKS